MAAFVCAHYSSDGKQFSIYRSKKHIVFLSSCHICLYHAPPHASPQAPHYHLQPFSYSFLPLSKKTKTKTFLQEQAVSVEEAELEKVSPSVSLLSSLAQVLCLAPSCHPLHLPVFPISFPAYFYGFSSVLLTLSVPCSLVRARTCCCVLGTLAVLFVQHTLRLILASE